MTEPEVRSLTCWISPELIEEWRELVVRLGGAYFQSPDWILSWWEAAGRPPSEIALWRGADGNLEGLVALSMIRERLHRSIPWSITALSNAGSGLGAADDCGWPLSPGLARDAMAWVTRRAGRHPVLLRSVSADAGSSVPPAFRRTERTPCPRLRLGDDQGDLPASSSFKKRLRQYRRRLSREGVTFQWIGPGLVEDRLFEWLVDLHRARRDAMGEPTSFGTRFASLHGGLVARGAENRGPAMVLAIQRDEIVGVLYGFVWEHTFYYYQTGWEPSLANLSLGTSLVDEAIHQARSLGLKIFDFLRGAEPYKYRFGAIDRFDDSWLLPQGATGRLLLAKSQIRNHWSNSAVVGLLGSLVSSVHGSGIPGTGLI
jgi:CelD/BcsL family acetyltransferase involved in cellulose biosynthesis